MINITFASTKGDDNQTPLTANLGGILAGSSNCVLVIDTNLQPKPSYHYKPKCQANHGLTPRLVNESSNTVNPKRSQNGLPF